MKYISLFARELMNLKHLRCMAHVLNLVVQKGLSVQKIKDMVAPVHKVVNLILTSPKKKQLFQEICIAFEIPFLNLIKDMPVRWNCTYAMLESALKMKSVIDYLVINNADFVEYTIRDWVDVQCLIHF
jgi:hypothetical protein